MKKSGSPFSVETPGRMADLRLRNLQLPKLKYSGKAPLEIVILLR